MSFGGGYIHRIVNVPKSIAQGVSGAANSVAGAVSKAGDQVAGISRTLKDPAALSASPDPALATLSLLKTEIPAVGHVSGELSGTNKQHELSDAAANQAAIQNADTQRTNALETQVNANYGVGLSPQAVGNSRLLTAAQQQAQNDAQLSGQSSADQQYQSGLAQERIGAARSGNLGSSSDAQARSGLLAQFGGNVAGSLQNAAAAGNQIQANNNAARTGLLQAIQGGQITDPAALQANIAGLGAQGGNAQLIQSIIGGGIQGGTNAFSQAALGNAYAGAR